MNPWQPARRGEAPTWKVVTRRVNVGMIKTFRCRDTQALFE